ncbi:MAG: FG-GAP-like repeat-containing protein [Phycisphaerales bacterium]
MVTANTDSNNVSVLMGSGAGTFAAPVNYPTGTSPWTVAVADVNGDGIADLVTANRLSNNVSVLLGSASGTFAAPVNYTTGTGPTCAAVADINGDGVPDIVVANESANNIGLLLGSGNGTFASQTIYAASNFPRSIAIADFNGDGLRDIAVTAVGNNTFWVLMNTSPGSPVPTFTQQPAGQIVAPGVSASLTASANFFLSPPTYQWRRNGVALTNGGSISGATSATLTINPVSTSDEAIYDVQAFSPSCNGNQHVVTSNTAVLAVTGPAAPTTPANDNCASAQPLPAAGYISFNTATATTDGPQEFNLGFGADPQIHKDVWFTYTATCTGAVTVGTCLSSFDTKVAIYSGTTCPGMPNSAIAGNDDSDCSFFGATKSQVIFNAIAGRTYLIRVGGKNGAAGDAMMTYTCDGSACLTADLGVQGGIAGRDGQLDNNDFIAFINAFFNHTTCP